MMDDRRSKHSAIQTLLDVTVPANAQYAGILCNSNAAAAMEQLLTALATH